ncbi:MAG: hypothetical protein KGD63_00955 [Candidatus Lokiarchaeota archaeon]|nr:hypothetical protein [Candidatus Lokiarchaeota archaeon]
MVMIPNCNKSVPYLSKFIDFDKKQNLFYDNLYIKDYDYVIKIPFPLIRTFKEKIKFEKFNLAKYTYLLDYE